MTKERLKEIEAAATDDISLELIAEVERLQARHLSSEMILLDFVTLLKTQVDKYTAKVLDGEGR